MRTKTVKVITSVFLGLVLVSMYAAYYFGFGEKCQREYMIWALGAAGSFTFWALVFWVNYNGRIDYKEENYNDSPYKLFPPAENLVSSLKPEPRVRLVRKNKTKVKKNVRRQKPNGK